MNDHDPAHLGRMAQHFETLDHRPRRPGPRAVIALALACIALAMAATALTLI